MESGVTDGLPLPVEWGATVTNKLPLTVELFVTVGLALAVGLCARVSYP